LSPFTLVIVSQGVSVPTLALFRFSLVHVAAHYDNIDMLAFLLGGGAAAALAEFLASASAEDPSLGVRHSPHAAPWRPMFCNRLCFPFGAAAHDE
jgi:hypothetical protein